MLTLTVEHDPDTPNPVDHDEYDQAWTFVSFSRRDSAYKDPCQYIQGRNQYGEVIPANIGIQRKLQVGTAFLLSNYSHGLTNWYLKGEDPMKCRWDSTDVAGILLWEHDPKLLPKTYEEREKFARAIVEEYTKWANGETYWYCLDREDEQIESCGGFIGYEELNREIQSLLKDYPNEEIQLKGDCACVVELEEKVKNA